MLAVFVRHLIDGSGVVVFVWSLLDTGSMLTEISCDAGSEFDVLCRVTMVEVPIGQVDSVAAVTGRLPAVI